MFSVVPSGGGNLQNIMEAKVAVADVDLFCRLKYRLTYYT